jgi:hypothetical protein
VAHIVHYSTSEFEPLMQYFSFSAGIRTDYIKSVPRYVTPNLCFCIQHNLQVAQFVLVHPGRETSTHYFSRLVVPGADTTKSAPGTQYVELVF